ncbi:hypothetical protein N7462_004525 [Penicillium macrosclerotiorum]|uniref:uncharacterized protein n=1 Tax=Penicillium macrosclerotiorum TaxID=303699 RepID=UPI0025498E62|nr:uncharacterized protein N7462_004525 [Penicillium macrosclerotiorum]KAJ5690133.1 hypothetical protein N7462_004525 [Penicillium macrosclerotiorum]
MALYDTCDGNWENLADASHLDINDVESFLDYAAIFLSNMGNYFGAGDQKFIPSISKDKVAQLASSAGTGATSLWEQIQGLMFQLPPFGLGPPGKLTQSSYYPGMEERFFHEDTLLVSGIMNELSILPENTRLMRVTGAEGIETLDILQASENENILTCNHTNTAFANKTIRLKTGDHARELLQINVYLRKALDYVSNSSQYEMIQKTIDSFTTGDISSYKDAQRVWVNDKSPCVETVLGFIEPYRDPLGIRSEFEGIVGIFDADESKVLNELAEISNELVCNLPWVNSHEASKGPFEKEIFEAPDFSSVQSLVYCSSIVFPGINLPNYNDIRQETGYKNIIFYSRMKAESQRDRGLHLIDASEQEIFKKHRFHAYYIWVVLHEILGHGTGRFLSETSTGKYNFNPESPPVNPVTGEPIQTCYRLGQTWTSVFGDLSTTVDECRAELVGAYLIDDPRVLALFGHTERALVTPDDLVYNLYLQLGTDGLRGLQNYDTSTQGWGQAHSRAHYAILRHLLKDANGLYTILCDSQQGKLTVKVDRARIIRHGKPSLGRMLLKLHIYRCTADVDNCRKFYEDLSRVDDEALKWRDIITAKQDPPLVFSQANTYLDAEGITIREYEASTRGVIQSWAERDIN